MKSERSLFYANSQENGSQLNSPTATTRGSKVTKTSQIKLKLRKETPYSKRIHRIFDDYELPLYDIYSEIKTLWEQGKGKLI